MNHFPFVIGWAVGEGGLGMSGVENEQLKALREINSKFGLVSGPDRKKNGHLLPVKLMIRKVCSTKKIAFQHFTQSEKYQKYWNNIFGASSWRTSFWNDANCDSRLSFTKKCTNRFGTFLFSWSVRHQTTKKNKFQWDQLGHRFIRLRYFCLVTICRPN